jgi:glycosyltransferase involved in cell wall biosynthesis
MIHLFINALAASAGAGITYARNVLPQLASRPDVRTTVALTNELRREIDGRKNVELRECKIPASAGRRFIFEQLHLPTIIRECSPDVLISAGNFALWNSPVPQILLSGNSLYSSRVFVHDLRRRRHYELLLDTKLKGTLAAASIRRADITVAPSDAFVEELRRWTGVRTPGRIVRIYHGFDAEVFRGSGETPVPSLAAQLAKPAKILRLLFVSHYNYYRNFETLLRALPLVRDQLPGRQVQLFLTCRLVAPEHSGAYRADSAIALVRSLGIGQHIVELGAVPYGLLHHVYRSCDIYVTPAYTETFAHPLVEAMSSGLPIIASDLGVHREICRDAAIYFQHWSAEQLAQRVVQVASNSALRQSLVNQGGARVLDFSWSRHVDELLELARGLIGRGMPHREPSAAVP